MVARHESVAVRTIADINQESKVQDYLNESIELVKGECGGVLSKVICYDWRASQRCTFQLLSVWLTCLSVSRQSPEPDI